MLGTKFDLWLSSLYNSTTIASSPMVFQNFLFNPYIPASVAATGSVSRAGNATIFDSTGKLTYAPNQLLLNNSSPSAANGWSGSAASESGGTVTFTGTGGYWLATLTGLSTNSNYIWAITLSSSNLTNVALRPVTGGLSEIAKTIVTLTSTPTEYYIAFNSGNNTVVRISLDNRAVVGAAGQAGESIIVTGKQIGRAHV